MNNYWDEDLAILSAENVSFSIETAGLGSRLAAVSLDSFIQLLVLTFFSLVIYGIDYYLDFITRMSPFMASLSQALFIFFVFLLMFGYFFVFEWLWEGQTPGKRQFGLRVVMSDGRPLSVWPALIRNVIRVADFMPPFYGIGTFVALTNSLNQRAGDLFAGTIVVREGKREQQRQPVSMREAIDKFLTAAATVPMPQSGEARYQEDEVKRGDVTREETAVDIEALNLARKITREDYELARDFLTRRDAMPRQARERLAHSLAVRLISKIGGELPPDHEAFLAEIVMRTRGLF